VRPPVTTETLPLQHLNLRTTGITQVIIDRSGAEGLVAPLFLQSGATR